MSGSILPMLTRANKAETASLSMAATISYFEPSFLAAHGLTKRATLERSVRGAVLIGYSKTMQMTGSKHENQYGGQNAKKDHLQAWCYINVCRCCCVEAYRISM